MSEKKVTIAIAGNPNCGKTALFNALTGARQNVGNWPGVTVEKKEGDFFIEGKSVHVVDLPGTYALFAQAEDERAAVDYLLSKKADLVVNILDAANIERNLFLTSQLIDMQVPMILAVNMMDIAEKRGIKIDLEKLSETLGIPVFELTAIRAKSVQKFVARLWDFLKKNEANREKFIPKPILHSEKIEEGVKAIEQNLSPIAETMHVSSRWLSLQLFANPDYLSKKNEALRASFDSSFPRASLDSSEAFDFDEASIPSRNALCDLLGEEPEFALATSRYAFARNVFVQTVERLSQGKTFSDKLDSILLHRVFAFPIFLVIMYLVFWVSVTVGSAFIDFFDILFGAVFVDSFASLLEYLHAPAWVISLLASGIGAGIQTVSTFVPVIFFMFLCLSFLEDSGYMARAAFVADRLMRFIGLPGRAFVPMIVGFGCSVPAIMGTRVLESKRERFLTIFLIPFMSCSARLPVYALFASAFFGPRAGSVVFLLYLSGILFAILYGLFLRKSFFKGSAGHFVMELPPYHLPRVKSLFIHSWNKLRDYIVRAGKVIVLAVALLGFLNSFGTLEKTFVIIDGKKTEVVKNEDGSYSKVDEAFKSPSFQKTIRINEKDIEKETYFTTGNDDSENSFLSHIGKAITPIFSPFGIEKENWPASVSLFTGLLAKEAVIGTMNSLYSMMESDDEETSLREAFVEALKSIPENLGETFSSLLDPLGISSELEAQEPREESEGIHWILRNYFSYSGAFHWRVFAFLIFILLYAPCLATMGVVVKEIGLFLGILLATLQTLLAFASAVLIYQIPFGKDPFWIFTAAIIFLLVALFLKILGKSANRKRWFED